MDLAVGLVVAAFSGAAFAEADCLDTAAGFGAAVLDEPGFAAGSVFTVCFTGALGAAGAGSS